MPTDFDAKMKKPIVLIGMMGAGKSHVGRLLAGALKVGFLDVDQKIEQETGKKIHQIFKNDGESTFRKLEQKVLQRLIQKEKCVIATGGGAVTNPELLEEILERCFVIWLKADIETLFERVRHTSHRPLLQQKKPKTILAKILKEREPLYSKAHLIVDTSKGDVEAVVKQLQEQLQKY